MAEPFTRGGAAQDLTEYDPLFYRGKSPVLGVPVELKTSGELPGQFPGTAAGAAPSAPTRPPAGTPPVAPNFSFDWPGLEFPTAPTPPIGSAETFGPGSLQPSWWPAALALADKGWNVFSQVNKLKDATGTPAASAEVFDPATVTNPGFWDAPFSAQNITAGMPLPQDYPPFPAETGGGGFSFGSLAPWLQAAGGAATIGMSPDPKSPAFAGGAINLAGGGASALSSLGVLGAGAAAAGPAAAWLTAPLVLGPALSALIGKGGVFGPDRPNWPEGYQVIPGDVNLAVDPTTGALLQYKGNGQYTWADQTLQGKPATPEQFLQWMIDPAGQLLNTPGYKDVQQTLMNRDVSASFGVPTPPLNAPLGTPAPTPAPQAPVGPTPHGQEPQTPATPAAPIPSKQHQMDWLMQWREPFIAKIRAANPGASEGEIWRLYTLTPEYQQEIAFTNLWAPHLPGS